MGLLHKVRCVSAVDSHDAMALSQLHRASGFPAAGQPPGDAKTLKLTHSTHSIPFHGLFQLALGSSKRLHRSKKLDLLSCR
ncbi:hypothetical protein RchiOBHm_Chr1g0380791 [Rosa chinensis]|uniref:Uncharacterized protein n=1 Tax=Rosa chinensis TaxID=74649 RepID=A0A2P6SP30_ROSCH|nr:hypothetical protein RchiOBHm_Chr1g0380791 [Rosa chinensis]